jgi:hypothetical protein
MCISGKEDSRLGLRQGKMRRELLEEGGGDGLEGETRDNCLVDGDKHNR